MPRPHHQHSTQASASHPYKQVQAHLKKHQGKHPHFNYHMTEFHPHHTLALLDEGELLLGFCTVNPSLREAAVHRPTTHHHLQTGIMEVLQSHCSKGLGQRILDQIVTIARLGGYKCVRTFAIDGAAEFYRKYGFVMDLSMIQHDMNVRFDLA